jgi:F0F1-type ATP synthase membrane subunit c/vacuolar-type H+-ATPase subunit K
MTQKRHNLTTMVVFITLVEGLAIYINMVAHPDRQPSLTVVIVILFAIVSGLVVWYTTRVRGMIFT